MDPAQIHRVISYYRLNPLYSRLDMPPFEQRSLHQVQVRQSVQIGHQRPGLREPAQRVIPLDL